MKTTTIGGTDLTISQICLGSTHIGTGIDRETSFALLGPFGSWLRNAASP
jgi:aryl-alcohol dehydrogenase-like predicted oxidoreductase